jgi:hypothetical protein
MSIIYGVLFMIFLVLNYENRRKSPEFEFLYPIQIHPKPGIWVQRSRLLLPWLPLACRRGDQMRASSRPERVSPVGDLVLRIGIRACTVSALRCTPANKLPTLKSALRVTTVIDREVDLRVVPPPRPWRHAWGGEYRTTDDVR